MRRRTRFQGESRHRVEKRMASDRAGLSAVDTQVLPGDVGRLITREKANDTGQFSSTLSATQRDLGGPFGGALLRGRPL